MQVTAAHHADQRRFREFAQAHVTRFADEFDRAESLPLTLIRALGNEGLLGLPIGREYGGGGRDALTCGLLHEEVGAACNATRSLLTVHEMVAVAIERWGTQEQRCQWLPCLASGRVIAAFAVSEPSTGSDLASVSTSATETSEGYVLHGQKKWISFGQIAHLFFVLARCAAGLTAFLVPRDAVGVGVQPIRGLLGLRASMLAEVTFDQVRVAKTARLGGHGFGLSHVIGTALLHGRFTVACGCVGIAQRCWTEATAYAGERRQFGTPLREHQLIKRLLTDLAVDTEAARLLCRSAADALTQRDPDAIVRTMMAKYFASQAAVRCADRALEVQGALGCSLESSIGRFWRDARLMGIIEGSSEIQQITIADCLYATREGAGMAVPILA